MNARKIEFNCVCGKCIDVMAEDGDILAVARGILWRVIGKVEGNAISALCPRCNAAQAEMARLNRETAQRNR